ncbi:hypothetical protein BDF14DRAFT_178694 [Spinellus fusiger]|nr:hypothetical protein BDF14DRAFT_178694 [Spinellus fusiger]
MAFIHQHRQPYRSRFSSVSSTTSTCSSSAEEAPTQRNRQVTSQSYPSDSENDWHIISTPQPFSSFQETPSTFEPSEPESFSSFRLSDTESFSDLDIRVIHHVNTQVFTHLPVHDGTGAFHDSISRQDYTPSSTDRRETSYGSLPTDQEESEMSAAEYTVSLPVYAKSVRRRQKDYDSTTSTDGNLDSIPTHHPSLPGSSLSAAVWASVWHHLSRLTNHLIENDTNATETFSTLLSEAAFEGCLPFSSPLHMEFNTGLHPEYSRQRLQGLQNS